MSGRRRPARRANPTPTRLIRQVERPIHGVRDADGNIDIQGTMQVVTSVIEGWVRKYPDQWLWQHRWR